MKFNFYANGELKCSISLEITEAAGILIEIKKITGSDWTIKGIHNE